MKINDHEIKIKIQKSIRQEICCEFIGIDPDKENFDTFDAINEIFRYIKQLYNQLSKQSSKKSSNR